MEGKNIAITDSLSAESMNNAWPWVASPVADSSLPEKYRGRFLGLGSGFGVQGYGRESIEGIPRCADLLSSCHRRSFISVAGQHSSLFVHACSRLHLVHVVCVYVVRYFLPHAGKCCAAALTFIFCFLSS